MVDISVIIVSYNVRLFLEQTINSVLKSIGELAVEVIVVDNNSSDNSIEHIKSSIAHPIKFISNEENVGFAKANNQGIEQANGKYVLLLNPDTVIQEDTLSKCFSFAEANSKVGAIGVKMVDGSGKFLPESKRSIPTPLNSFWKLTGLSKIFPDSKLFSGYNLGHISEDVDAEIEVLCGAFMFMPTQVVKEIGLLDDDYFMYGEDIDLSFRILRAGYKVWYLGSSSIIHYKGQSTQKSSLGYVNTFYNAMSIFAGKHYGSSRMLLIILSIAIGIRQLSSILKRVINFIFPILFDAIIFFIGFILIKNIWEDYQFGDANYYESKTITLNIIIYVSVWILAIWASRSYARYFSIKVFSIATAIGLFAILIMYGLLPEYMRTSRAIILIGAIWVFISGISIRLIVRFFKGDANITNKRIGILGSTTETKRVKDIIHNSIGNNVFIQQLSFDDLTKENLVARKDYHRLNEIIFCLKDFAIDKALKVMTYKISGLNYKIIGDNSFNIIGSSKSNMLGEIYGLDINYQIANENNLYYKRCIDIIFGLLLVLIYPVLLFNKNLRQEIDFSGLLQVILGRKTLIGYNKKDTQIASLPPLNDAWLQLSNSNLVEHNLHEINTSYALHYTAWRDIVILSDKIF